MMLSDFEARRGLAPLALLLLWGCGAKSAAAVVQTSHEAQAPAEVREKEAIAAAALPANFEAGFEEPARLRIAVVDEASGEPLEADIYVLPDLEAHGIDVEEEQGAALYDRLVQRLGQTKHYWYADDSGPYSYSSRRTSQAGIMEVEVSAALALQVQASGTDQDHGSLTVPVGALEAGSSRELRVALSTEANLSFHGQLKVVGAPLGGARIELFEYGTAAAAPVRSDAEGFFYCNARDWTRPQAIVSAEGLSPVRVHLLEGHESRESACQLELTPAAELTLKWEPQLSGSQALLVSAELVELPHAIDYHLAWFGSEWRRSVEARGAQTRLADLPAGVELELELGGRHLGSVQLSPGAQTLFWTGAELGAQASGPR